METGWLSCASHHEIEFKQKSLCFQPQYRICKSPVIIIRGGKTVDRRIVVLPINAANIKIVRFVGFEHWRIRCGYSLGYDDKAVPLVGASN
jgi:hypothetical protein